MLVQEVSFKAGDILGLDGAEGEHIFLIAEGQVAMLRSALDSCTSDAADEDMDDIVSEEDLGWWHKHTVMPIAPVNFLPLNTMLVCS